MGDREEEEGRTNWRRFEGIIFPWYGLVWFGLARLGSVRHLCLLLGNNNSIWYGVAFCLVFFCLFFAGLDGTDERTNERVGGRQDRPRGVFGFGYMWTNGISSQGIVYSVCATTTGLHSQGGLYTKPGRI